MDYENEALKIILDKYGNCDEENENYELLNVWPSTNDLEDFIYILGVKNKSKNPIEVTLDCTSS